jgi:DNA-binding MarR family transcriptional regulator
MSDSCKRVHPIEATVGFRIAMVCRAHRNRVAARLAEFGLYLGQEMILMQLWKEDGMTQTCLSGRVGIDISTMTKALQRMERYGLIERRPDCADHRASHVFLTEQGRTLEREITTLWQQVEECTFANFTAAERIQLAHLLKRIPLNLE